MDINEIRYVPNFGHHLIKSATISIGDCSTTFKYEDGALKETIYTTTPVNSGWEGHIGYAEPNQNWVRDVAKSRMELVFHQIRRKEWNLKHVEGF